MPDEDKTFSGSLGLMTSRAHTLYNPTINFRAILLATLRHVVDSYHAISPVWVDICRPQSRSQSPRVFWSAPRHGALELIHFKSPRFYDFHMRALV